MSGNRTENNALDRPLDKAEREELTDYLVEAIDGWKGQTPFRAEPEGDWRELEHRPDLKGNRLFPHIGYREANRFGQDFQGALAAQAAARGKSQPKLHLVTLRLSGDRPSPEDLDEHLGRLSKAVSQVFDDIQHSPSVPSGTTPLLTALHIRMSDVDIGHFDPHVHAIVEIPGNTVSSVHDYLSSASTRQGERFFGAVWLERETVRKPKDAAFYVAAGVVDYRHLRDWPEAALMAVWGLSKRKMLRRAGWFATSAIEDDAVTNQDGSVSPSPISGQPDATIPLNSPSEAIMDSDTHQAAGDWRSNLFPMLLPYLPAEHSRLTRSTVRAVSAGKTNLTAYPTLGETLACAIIVIEAEQRVYDRKYTEVLDAYGFDKRQFEEGQRRVESFFHIRLFHPGIGYMPTSEGVIWAKTVMSGFKPIIKMAEEGRGKLVESYKDKDRLGEGLLRG